MEASSELKGVGQCFNNPFLEAAGTVRPTFLPLVVDTVITETVVRGVGAPTSG